LKVIEASIRFPVTVVVGVLIAIMAGLIALTFVPIQLSPDVDRPVINVTTVWPGASPEEIEKEIIEEQEEYLKSVEGVLEMNSESQDGRGTITLEFAAGTDITGATVKVSNKLDEVRDYPDDAERPIVSSSGQFDKAIGWFIVNALDTTIYVPHQERLIEDLVVPRLERVNGVSKVNVFGGLEEELHVTFDPEYLASSGITINQLMAALRAENRDISGGDFGEGKRRYVVRTVSRFESIEDVKETVVAVRAGVPIRVKDVAQVELGYEKPRALVRQMGQPSIAMNVQRQIGANVLEVTDGLMKQVDIVNAEVLHPIGLNLENVYRETVYINSAVDLVFNNIFLGGFLAILVLFLFLRSPSSILVIAVSIPISIVTAFFVMFAFGRTINVISLAGMAFAVGMVVDAAIVVLENIYRHLQMGKPRWQAAADGAREVWGAIFASTVTTVAVFLPVMFVQERAGQLFRDIAIAIASAILVSLIVSITVIPSLSSRILKVSSGMQNQDPRQTVLGRFAARVAALVDYVNRSGRRRLGTILGIIIVSMGLTWLLLPETEYLPNGNQNLVIGFMLPPPGYNIDEMVRVGQNIENRLRPYWNVDESRSEDVPGGGIENFFYVAFSGQAFMGMRAHEDARVKELLPVANGVLQSVPGAIGFASQTSLFERGFAGTRSVKVDVTGPELATILQIAGRVFGQMSEVVPGSNSRPIPGLDLGNPEVRVYPDRVRAADAGFSASDIGTAVNVLVDGMDVSDYRYQGNEIDLILRGRGDLTRHTQNVEELPLATPGGRVITLGDIATIKQRQGPVQINHVERQRAVSIETVLPDDIALEEAIARIENQIVRPLRQEGQIGGLYDISISGTADDLSKLRGELQNDFHIAIILTYLLLAALFQSFVYPLVILLTVPLATFGGVLGLRTVQIFDPTQQLDVLTMLGFVILVGTVINNSILIVYHALQRMREGDTPREAVKESVRVRVRPIFMSTATSALGMLPLVIMPGAGSELYRGLGSVVVGGLSLSAVITLILTPLVFSYAVEGVVKVRSLFGMKETAVKPERELEPKPSN
jgi:HAE1 family hydrophobic/amphiphilic exporter-1